MTSERDREATPIAITSDGDGVFAFAWRMRGVLRVTVVVKVFRTLTAEGKLTPVEAEPPRRTDRHDGNDPSRPVCEPSDVVPFREHADIVVIAPAAGPAFCRVAVARAGTVVFEKSVALPARAEKSAQGAGFAAAAVRTPAFARGVMELPDALDRCVFQCTPLDQRVAELRPNDQVLLQGLHPGVDRVVFSLPDHAPKAAATLDAASHDVSLRCDQLLVDRTVGRVVQTWRGSFTMPDEPALRRVAIRVSGAAPITAAASFAGTVALEGSAPALGGQPRWLAPPGPPKGNVSTALLRKIHGAPLAGMLPSAVVKPATPGAGTAFIEPNSSAGGTIMVEANAPASLPFERVARDEPAPPRGRPDLKAALRKKLTR